MFGTAILILILPAIVSAYDCTNQPDGNYEIGCKVFVECVGSKPTIIECPGDTVFNKNTTICDDPKNVPPPCGLIRDCSHLQDGRYPDIGQKCVSYFTCHAHYYLGHNFCPGGTIFNDKLNGCDWKYDVEPPCGTKGVSTPTP